MPDIPLEGPTNRVLLLMATQTYRASAFLEAAARLDLTVAVGSEEEPVLGHLNRSGNLQVDFHDLEGATDQIVEFASEYPLKAIVSTDDDGVVIAAMASDALGLSHNPLVAVRAARDKYLTRRDACRRRDAHAAVRTIFNHGRSSRGRKAGELSLRSQAAGAGRQPGRDARR